MATFEMAIMQIISGNSLSNGRQETIFAWVIFVGAHSRLGLALGWGGGGGGGVFVAICGVCLRWEEKGVFSPLSLCESSHWCLSLQRGKHVDRLMNTGDSR